MAKTVYIVLAISKNTHDLLDVPGDKGLAAVLQTLQANLKVIYFDSLADATDYCALAGLPKYIHTESQLDRHDKASDPLTTACIKRQIDASANPEYELTLGNNHYVLKANQSYANLTGFQADEVVTVTEANFQYFGAAAHVIKLSVQNSKEHTQRIYSLYNTQPQQILPANHPDRDKPVVINFNPSYSVHQRNDYLALREDGEYGWQHHLMHGPLQKFVILRADADALVSDKNTWQESFEPKCVVTTRQAQVSNLYREPNTHYLTFAEDSQVKGEQAPMSYRIGFKQHILALSGDIHNSKGFYNYNIINFEAKYQKLNLLKWFLIKNNPLLLKKFAKHFWNGEQLMADPEELKKSLEWDLYKILKYVKYAEIHGIFKELANEFGKEHAAALISARDTIEQAFMERQANKDFYWELASALTFGLAWLLRKIFFSNPQEATPVEATFNLRHLSKGMHDFYQPFRNAIYLGYEQRAANVVGAYQDKTHFLKHLRDKQGRLQFNKCGEMSKEIIAIDAARDQITVRGTDAEIRRWKLMERFGRKDSGKQRAAHASYQQKLESSKSHSKQITEQNDFKPRI